MQNCDRMHLASVIYISSIHDYFVHTVDKQYEKKISWFSKHCYNVNRNTVKWNILFMFLWGRFWNRNETL